MKLPLVVVGACLISSLAVAETRFDIGEEASPYKSRSMLVKSPPVGVDAECNVGESMISEKFVEIVDAIKIKEDVSIVYKAGLFSNDWSVNKNIPNGTRLSKFYYRSEGLNHRL